MEKKTFGDIIVELRKEQNLTQQELAKKLNITDKAVSKWERGLSYPDITSISMLAKTLNVDSSYLIDLCKKEDNFNHYESKDSFKNIIILSLKAIALAMSISVAVLNILDSIKTRDSFIMLGIGLFCISILFFNYNNENK